MLFSAYYSGPLISFTTLTSTHPDLSYLQISFAYLIPDTFLAYSKLANLPNYRFFIFNQIKNLASIYICQVSLPTVSYQVAFHLNCRLDLLSQITNSIHEWVTSLTFLYKSYHLLATQHISPVLKDAMGRVNKWVIGK